eukprot:COSAG02_NODE_37062_length_447_cov_0.580460_2_plen_60_part_01
MAKSRLLYHRDRKEEKDLRRRQSELRERKRILEEDIAVVSKHEDQVRKSLANPVSDASGN